MHAGKVEQTADHMIVSHLTGNQEDVLIFSDAGQLSAKRLVRKMDFPTPVSAYSPVTAIPGHDLASLSADDEKRLLAIYEMFSKA